MVNSVLVNQLIALQEQGEAILCQLEALVMFARLTDDFSEFNKKTVQNYLWAVSDLIIKAVEANQLSLSLLLKCKN